MTAKEAGEMWVDGQRMPREAGIHPLQESRIRRSEDGHWVIRLKPRPEGDAAAKTALVECEYERLLGLGLKVVNFASIASVSGRKIFTVTPWIPGLHRQTCDFRQYATEVEPILRIYDWETRFLKEEGVDSLNIAELMDPDQHSWSDEEGYAFTHDVDPSLVSDLLSSTVQNTNSIGLAMEAAGIGRTPDFELQGHQPAEQAQPH